MANLPNYIPLFKQGMNHFGPLTVSLGAVTLRTSSPHFPTIISKKKVSLSDKISYLVCVRPTGTASSRWRKADVHHMAFKSVRTIKTNQSAGPQLTPHFLGVWSCMEETNNGDAAGSVAPWTNKMKIKLLTNAACRSSLISSHSHTHRFSYKLCSFFC